MAVFRYSMENILSIKVKIEEQKKMELGQAMMAYQEEIEEENRLMALLDETIGIFKEKQNGAMRVMEFKGLSQGVNYYEKALEVQKDIVHRALDVVEIKRVALKKALEEKKIQEKLKEKALEAFVEEEKGKEQKLLDEIVGFRYANNQMKDNGG